MQLETKKNYLSFFSGYPRIALEPHRIQIDYEDFFLRPKRLDDAPAARLSAHSPAELPELGVGRSPQILDPGPDTWDPLRLGARKFLPPAAPSLHLPSVPQAPKPVDPHASSRSGGGADLYREIEVKYDNKGDPLDLRATQINTLHDDDIVIGPDGESSPWPHHHTASLHDLVHTAEAQIPEAYVGAAATPESIVATLQALGDYSLPAVSAPMQAGVTLDGVVLAADAAPPKGPADLVPEMPTDTSANMAVIHTGDNLAMNFAGIADTQGAIGTLVVLGDSYKSNVIVQTNVLVDQSVIAGTSDKAVIQAGGNEASNVAEFIQTLAHNPYEMGYFGGLQWNVDRVSGDYYNVKLVTQTNDMRDNDLVQHTATDHYKMIDTGSNEQINELTATQTGAQYDLTIVTGSHYSANWIFQTNVLLNSDYVQVDEGPGGSGTETVSTGASWLTNSATIADYSGGSSALSSDMRSLASDLQRGEQTLDIDKGFIVPGDGSMKLNVLFITGNYYDFNVLTQTNMVSDSDVVKQTLGNGESGYVSTGSNSLSNEALLVTLGPLGGQHVGGQQYSESVLVQTNIITQSIDMLSSKSGLVLNDPAKLAPEVAALIQHGAVAAMPVEHSTTPMPMETAAHTASDPLSSVLS
ncbi:MAG: hypothetical protein ABS35_17800 [Kaistia sp. SCN 65-12]|nr:MAG: hypothetical protein ABS35_17800 [Kaistia sp. SCN 65-12]